MIIEIMIGVGAAILSAYLPLKFRNRLKVVSLKKGQTARINKFIDLYIERIPENQRVPPDHIIKFLNSEKNAASLREFRKKVALGYDTVHFLLLATSGWEVMGFTKVIYVKSISCLFVAYIAVSNHGSAYEQHVVSKLLAEIVQYAKAPKSINSLMFEIVINDNTREHVAKEKRFRHYARAKNYKLKKIAAKYYQPEVCSFDTGECGMEAANLFLLHLGADDGSMEFSRPSYENLIRSLYTFIYMESFRQADYQLADDYQKFLENIIQRTMSEQIGEKISVI